MKSKSLAILLLAIFAVSSLKGVWSYEDVDVSELDDQAVDIEEAVDESDLYDASEQVVSSRKKKPVCRVQTKLYGKKKCLAPSCKKVCMFVGYTIGTCSKLKADKVPKCYCEKHGVCKKGPIHVPGHAPHSPPRHGPKHGRRSPPHSPKHKSPPAEAPVEGPESAPVLSGTGTPFGTRNSAADALAREDPLAETYF